MNWISDIRPQTYVVLITGLIGVMKMARLTFHGNLVLILIWQNIVVDTGVTYLLYKNIISSSNLIYSVHLAVQFLIMLYIYSIEYERPIKFIFYFAMFVLSVFSIYNLFYLQKEEYFNTYTSTPFSIIIAILSYLLLRRFILTEKLFFNNVLFWFALANFIYFSITVPILSVMPIANSYSNSIALKLTYVNYGAYIISSILIGIGFLCLKKKTI